MKTAMLVLLLLLSFFILACSSIPQLPVAGTCEKNQTNCSINSQSSASQPASGNDQSGGGSPPINQPSTQGRPTISQQPSRNLEGRTGQANEQPSSHNCTRENLKFYGYGFDYPDSPNRRQEVNLSGPMAYKSVSSCRSDLTIHDSLDTGGVHQESSEELVVYFPNRAVDWNGPKEYCVTSKGSQTSPIERGDTHETRCFGVYAEPSYNYQASLFWQSFGVACLPENGETGETRVLGGSQIVENSHMNKRMPAENGCTTEETKTEKTHQQDGGIASTSTKASHCTIDLTQKGSGTSTYKTCCKTTTTTEDPYQEKQSKTEEECR